ncbi:MAG: ribonuclease Z [Deferribacterota bacterium]|nr:ribonuclease Z [Deferribacterota bacterium]
MRNNYTIKKVNSPFDDTCFFIRNVYKKKALLFDCGRIGGLNNTEILSLRDIFISHAHIDHFYGFDRLLRTFLRSDKKLRFYGPPGFINNVIGKLSGYTWNLVDNYDFELEAYELNSCGKAKIALFKASNYFKPIIYYKDNLEYLSLDDGFKVVYEFFDHSIPVIGYRIKEAIHVNIKKDVLCKYDYVPGPWLTELKARLRSNYLLSDVLEVETKDGKKRVKLGLLADQLVIFKPPQDITFITDFAPTYENYSKAITFASNSYILLIESMFLKKDILHAIDKSHSTTSLSKQIFLESGSKFVHFFHFSSKYEKSKDEFMYCIYKDIDKKII